MRTGQKTRYLALVIVVILAMWALVGCGDYEIITPPPTEQTTANTQNEQTDRNESIDKVVNVGGAFDYSIVPQFDGHTPYYVVNGNQPYFEEKIFSKTAYESYGALDSYGRCTVAISCIGKELMPTEDRGSIGSVKPSGWQMAKYDCVDGKYLYNRCHLIGFQLTGENANECNLITGTRYMNVDGMLPFENMVADYIKETNNHVMYRITPIFVLDELVARGVLMEAYSIEDDGEGVCFNVFCYNNQPQIEIDYHTGESRYVGSAETDREKPEQTDVKYETYVLNTKAKKIHYSTCRSVKDIKEENKETYNGDRQDLIEQGYTPCGNCKP